MAKQLLTETRLPLSHVAYASGFGSVRRFNAAFRDRYRLNPDAVRQRAPSHHTSNGEFVQLSLSFRPPMAWTALLGFLGARATPGVEVVDATSYARTVRVGQHTGIVRASFTPGTSPSLHRHAVLLEVSPALMPELMWITSRVRHLFDLDAEPVAIAQHLSRAGLGALAPLRRGLRVPGAFDGFELAVRAILGQQVSVKGATTLMGRLTQALGEPLPVAWGALTHLSPSAARVAESSLARIRDIGLPVARAATIFGLAKEVARGALRLEPDVDAGALIRQLVDLPGVGDWTAAYIAMRALHWPDAFPASDLVLRRAAGNVSAAQLTKLAEPWRPWRAYAALTLWMKPLP